MDQIILKEHHIFAQGLKFIQRTRGAIFQDTMQVQLDALIGYIINIAQLPFIGRTDAAADTPNNTTTVTTNIPSSDQAPNHLHYPLIHVWIITKTTVTLTTSTKNLTSMMIQICLTARMMGATEDAFTSRLFTVPKRTGDLRLCLNLCPLNQFVPHQHFKVKTVNAVCNLINKGDYMTSIDLQDAFLHILPRQCPFNKLHTTPTARRDFSQYLVCGPDVDERQLRHNLQDMTEFPHCLALVWMLEQSAGSRTNPLFSICCSKGQITIPKIMPYDKIMHLLQRKTFYRDIRKYNSAMVLHQYDSPGFSQIYFYDLLQQAALSRRP
ncbi:MAG: hypothetical protein J3R72DRAFT_491520 [Linnemannia gamsii]|nr:MAG: hypothetical protein J3R72DRAFT_491520 [Linnemannia gamsii]